MCHRSPDLVIRFSAQPGLVRLPLPRAPHSHLKCNHVQEARLGNIPTPPPPFRPSRALCCRNTSPRCRGHPTRRSDSGSAVDGAQCCYRTIEPTQLSSEFVAVGSQHAQCLPKFSHGLECNSVRSSEVSVRRGAGFAGDRAALRLHPEYFSSYSPHRALPRLPREPTSGGAVEPVRWLAAWMSGCIVRPKNKTSRPNLNLTAVGKMDHAYERSFARNSCKQSIFFSKSARKALIISCLAESAMAEL